MESLQNLLSLLEQCWVSFFALLSSPSKLVDIRTAAMVTLIKASRAMYSAYTLASKQPLLTDLVSAGTLGPT
jgi:hypothetical protein